MSDKAAKVVTSCTSLNTNLLRNKTSMVPRHGFVQLLERRGSTYVASCPWLAEQLRGRIGILALVTSKKLYEHHHDTDALHFGPVHRVYRLESLTLTASSISQLLPL